jgi:thiamine transport system permease protein
VTTGRARRLAAAVPAAFAAVMVAWPLLAILRRGFALGDGLSLDTFSAFGDVFGSARERHIIVFTIEQAAVSTALTMTVGLPAAWATSRRFAGVSLVRAAFTVTFVLPTVVMGIAFRALFDRGVLAIVLAHAAFNVAVVVRVVGAAWERLDTSAEDAARTLGAGRARAFVDVTLARLAPAIAASALITFLFSFTSFGVIAVLGDARTGTIETEIWRLARRLALDRAAVLTLVQLAVVVVVLAVAARTARTLVEGDVDVRRPSASSRLAVAAALGPAAALAAAPMVVLVARVVRPGGRFGLAAVRALVSDDTALAVRPIATLATSVRYCTVATAVAGTVGGLAAIALAGRRGPVRRGLDALLLLPLGVSAVTIGYGYLITFDEPPLELRSYWWIVPLAHAAVAVPFVIRVVLPALRSIDPRWREAATTLGASPARAWRDVDVPLAGRAFAVGIGFAAAISLGEFGATALLAREGTPTAPFAIARLLGRPGERNVFAAEALALALGLLTTVVVLVSERAGRARVGGTR